LGGGPPILNLPRASGMLLLALAEHAVSYNIWLQAFGDRLSFLCCVRIHLTECVTSKYVLGFYIAGVKLPYPPSV